MINIRNSITSWAAFKKKIARKKIFRGGSVIKNLITNTIIGFNDFKELEISAIKSGINNAVGSAINNVVEEVEEEGDVTLPTITSVTYNVGTGILVVTGTNFEAKTGANNDVDISKFTFKGESNNTYTITSTSDVEITSATEFSVTLSGIDKTSVNGLLNKNGTTSDDVTTYNLKAADNFIANLISGNSSDLTNPVTVSGYSVPTVTSATYDYGTGALVVTGINFVSNVVGSDIDVSKFTFTGEASNTYTLTSSDVEITNETSFIINLNAADILNVNGLLNKNGTSSDDVITYNLDASDNWMIGAPASVNISDTTNAITASNVVVPTVTSSTYDYATGILVVTGTNLVKKVGATNDVDISKFTFKGEAAGTYTITSASDIEITSGTSFTFTLTGSDKTNVEDLLNKNGSSSEDSTSYNLDASDNWLVGAAPSVDISDATNGITVSNVVAPAITSAAYDFGTGILVVTGTNLKSKAGANNDIDVSMLTLKGESSNTYILTSSDIDIDSGTQFTVTLNATDILNINGLLNKNGTSSDDVITYNLDAADNWMTLITSGDTSDSTNVITVSNYVSPAITSATYDISIGSLIVTGTNFVKEPGANNDIDSTKFTIKGEASDTYVLTSSNVEITNDTTFTIPLNSTDQTNINGLLNKNGTTSDDVVTYNIAAADNWMAGSPDSVNIEDLTGNVITVSNVVVPTITSATYDAATGILVVTGTNLVNKVGANNDVDISKFTFTGEASGTHTITSASDVEITSGTSFTITLSGSDKTNVDSLLNKDGTTSADVTTYNLSAADDWLVGAAPSVVTSDLTNGITVSGVSEPVISSATYDFGTGILVVTGANFSSKTGANNDVDISKFTFTGEGGSTYTITSTSDVEITSATEFSVTLTGSDKTSINGLLNKNGTTSDDVTTYNLSAADDWMANIIAGDTSDTTNVITVSSVVVPTVTSATYDFGTGAVVITGTNFVKEPGANNDVDISKFTFTGEASNTYTITSTSDVEITSETSLTFTISGSDKTNLNGLLNKNGTTSDDVVTYNLNALDNWMKGSANSSDISDATGNGITVSNYITPTITSATYDFTSASLVITGTNFVNKSGAGNDVDTSLLTLKGEASNTYTLTSSDVEITSGTSFTIALSSTDKVNINGLLNKNGTTSDDVVTYNLNAADNWMAGAANAANISDATNAITVSNVIVPTVTSSTYDYATGILVVTGANFVIEPGANNDIDTSLFTIKGETSDTYILTSSDVEISSATEFTINLNSADTLNVNGLLNKNGTTSDDVVTYNIAAADNWMKGSANGTNIEDLTGNGITVSNVSVPTVTSATYDAGTGVCVVTSVGLVKKVGATNDVDISKFTFKGEAAGTYTVTSTSDVEITSGTSLTFTLTGSDKTNVDSLLNKDGTTSADVTTYNLSAADDWLVGAATGTNISDATNAITVSGNAAGTVTTGLDLDGSADYLTVTTNAIFGGKTKASIGMYINFDSVSGDQRFFNETKANNTTRFLMRSVGTELYFGIRDDTTSTFHQAITSGLALAIDTWYCIIGTVDTTTDSIKIYVDGVEKASSSPSISAIDNTTPGTATTVGKGNIGDYTDGSMSLVNAWDKVLSASEISEFSDNKLAYSALSTGIKTNLMHSWDMADDIPSDTNEFQDQVGTNHLTNTGGSFATGKSITITE